MLYGGCAGLCLCCGACVWLWGRLFVLIGGSYVRFYVVMLRVGAWVCGEDSVLRLRYMVIPVCHMVDFLH